MEEKKDDSVESKSKDKGAEKKATRIQTAEGWKRTVEKKIKHKKDK